MRYILILIVIIGITLQSCVEISQPFSKIPPGMWRGSLTLDEGQFLPFNFEIDYDETDELVMTIHNAEERIVVEDIWFERTKKLEDTLVIDFPLLDSHLALKYKENVLEGSWVVRNKENYSVPFVAHHGQNWRFTNSTTTPETDLSGMWQASFEIETEDEYPAIAEFKQSGNQLTGTFRTETGDYRYLEGEVNGDRFALSCFDGSHAFLFKGRINQATSLTGEFLSGNHYRVGWLAQKNENASLTDPSNLTQVTTSDARINFSFPNTYGNMVSLDDSNLAGKPKIIMIMGTWCPNCLDESKFILDYQSKNDLGDIKLLAIAFERYKEESKALQMIEKYKERLEVPYDILYGGYYNKAEATKTLGFVDKIMSYPTLLFVDRNNKVLDVHTGFNGPATSKYEAFVKYFGEMVNELKS